jgi:hypothetical protein
MRTQKPWVFDPVTEGQPHATIFTKSRTTNRVIGNIAAAATTTRTHKRRAQAPNRNWYSGPAPHKKTAGEKQRAVNLGKNHSTTRGSELEPSHSAHRWWNSNTRTKTGPAARNWGWTTSCTMKIKRENWRCKSGSGGGDSRLKSNSTHSTRIETGCRTRGQDTTTKICTEHRSWKPKKFTVEPGALGWARWLNPSGTQTRHEGHGKNH